MYKQSQGYWIETAAWKKGKCLVPSVFAKNLPIAILLKKKFQPFPSFCRLLSVRDFRACSSARLNITVVVHSLKT